VTTVTGGSKTATHQFKFDGLMDGTGQETVYDEVARDVVEGTLAGYNGTIFCYGQTGAGKTYTMCGHPAAYSKHRGIIPRALASIFQEIELKLEKEYTVKVSYLEIYNETLYDLLSESPTSSDDLAIVDRAGSVEVQGLTCIPVTTEEEALECFFRGQAMRSTAEHVLNANSSRSHSVFTVHIKASNTGVGPERAVVSKLHLVDLAGSERTKKTGSLGQTLREASYINRSLSFLEQVVQSLCKKERHVPFRQSKLTSLLRDALGGNSRTVMVANVWGEAVHGEETMSTLRFAQRVRQLQTDSVINESNDPGFLMRKYERIIRELKQELAMRDALNGRAAVGYDDMTEAELRDLRATIRKFIDGETSDVALPCESLKRIREAYRQFREVFLDMRKEMETRIPPSMNPSFRMHNDGVDGPDGMMGGDALDGTVMTDPEAATGVGNLDNTAHPGFHAGVAPSGFRPTEPQTPGTIKDRGSRGDSRAVSARSRMSVGVHDHHHHQQQQQHEMGFPSPYSVGGGFGGFAVGSAMSAVGGASFGTRAAAFDNFKRSDKIGRRIAEEMRQAAHDLTEAKKSLKEAARAANGLKVDIDQLAEKVDERRKVTGDGEVTDAELFQHLQELKSNKVMYRQQFDRVKLLRSEIEELAGKLAEKKTELIVNFEKFFGEDEQASPLAFGGVGFGGGAPGDMDGLDGDDQDDEYGGDKDPYATAAKMVKLKGAGGKAKGPVGKTPGAKTIAETNRRIEKNLKAMSLA